MTEASASAPRTADPTLLELARAGSRWARLGFVVLAAGVVVGLLSLTVLRPGKPKGGGASARVDGAPSFKVDYARAGAESREVRPGEPVARRQGDDPQGSRLYVTPLRLAPYEGSPSGAMPLATPEARRTIAARFDAGSVAFIDEGLVNVGPNPATSCRTPPSVMAGRGSVARRSSCRMSMAIATRC